MRIKKYVADNYSDALAQVKREMGSDALIMTTRSIREESGFGGGTASRVEITAAIDSAAIEEMNRSMNSTLNSPLEPSTELSGFDEEAGPDLKAMLFSLLSHTEQAQSLGLKSHQFEWFSHLVENGMSERIASKIIARSDSANKANSLSSDKKRIIETMKRVIGCRGGIEPD